MNSSTCSSFLQTTTVRIDGILRHPHSTTPPAFDVPSKTALTIQGIYTFCCWVPNITPTVLHTLPTLLYLSFVYQSLWCVHGFTCTCYKPQNRNKPPEWIYCTLEASGQKNSISQQPAPTNTLPYSLRWGMNKPQLPTKTTRNAVWCCKRPSKLKKLRFYLFSSGYSQVWDDNGVLTNCIAALPHRWVAQHSRWQIR